MNNALDSESALQKAFTQAQASYTMAKAAAAESAIADVLGANDPGLAGRQQMRALSSAEAMRHYRSYVYTAIRPIAQAIAGQPIRVGVPKKPSRTKRLSAKFLENYEPVETHPILDLLADPSDIGVAWTLIFTLVASCELCGRGFIWATEVDGRRMLLNVPTSWVVGYEGDGTSISAWILQRPGSNEKYPVLSSDMIYVAYPDPADPCGAVSPLMAAAAAVETDEALQSSQRAMMRSGVMPKLAVLIGKNPHESSGQFSGHRPRLTGAQKNQIIRAIKEAWASTRPDSIAILDGLIEDVKKLQMTPAEMDFLASGEATKKRILQAFGTPPAVLGEELTNLASSRAADLHFAKYTVNPKIELISQCLQEWKTALGAREGEKLAIWIEPLPVKDDEIEIKKYQILGQFGACTKDELRANLLGLPPMPHGVGTFPISESDQGGIEAAINRHIQTVTHAEAGEYLRVAESSREARERRLERSNGKHS